MLTLPEKFNELSIPKLNVFVNEKIFTIVLHKEFIKIFKKVLHFIKRCDRIYKRWRQIKLLIQYAPVAQLDRVTGYEPVGQGFESLLAHQKSTFFERGMSILHITYLLFPEIIYRFSESNR